MWLMHQAYSIFIYYTLSFNNETQWKATLCETIEKKHQKIYHLNTKLFLRLKKSNVSWKKCVNNHQQNSCSCWNGERNPQQI